MKILVLQLARLGDIYLSWPAIRALRRQYPQAELHLMIRYRFRHATEGLDDIDHLWILETHKLLEPLLDDSADLNASTSEVVGAISQLRAQNYDLIINLTYSPVSSYLTKSIAQPTTQVRGYSRSDDGFLSIPDDASAYFFAQVGIGRDNRIHLSEIFAQAADVSLVREDWRPPEVNKTSSVFTQPYIVLHLGASQIEKSYWPEKWKSVARQLLASWDGNLVLIGSTEEKKSAQIISDSPRILNLVGQTRLYDLFPLIKNSQLLIGADSAPIHIASLTHTKCLNLSFECVNFWETGPKTPGSRILWAPDPGGLPSDRVVGEAINLLVDLKPLGDVVTVADYTESYQLSNPKEFSWDLISCIYLGGPFPITAEPQILSGIQKIYELNRLAQKQLQEIARNPGNQTLYGVLERIDETIDTVARLVRSLAPLVRWYQTEKVRLGPMSVSELVHATWRIHEQLDGFIVDWWKALNLEVTHALKA